MKKKKLFKNTFQMVVYLILFIVCIALFIIVGTTDYKKSEESDSIRFSHIYNSVPSNNLYVFANANDVLDIIKSRSGIILMGFSSNKFMNNYANILNLVASELKIDRILYYDFLTDRDQSNGTYEMIVKLLSDYAPMDDEGIQNIYAPTVLVVKNGQVIAYFDDASKLRGNVSPEDYFDKDKTSIIYEEFKTALTQYVE